MRGEDERSGSLFSYVDLEARVGKDLPREPFAVWSTRPWRRFRARFRRSMR